MDLMQDLRRTCYCGEVTKAGETVVVGGFVQKVRNLGNLIFIDLRDRTGIVQLAFNDQTDRAIFEKAASCHSEYVLLAKGVVAERSSINKDMKTGTVEVLVDDLRVLSKAQTPPFAITDETKTNEELRLKYRYLDLRRAPLQHNLMMRHKIALAAREYFYANNFIEIETPMMMKSTPEGARDYLIPSRVHNGKFYALPQSPQIYKQLLMVAGMDRYIQIARCFRDEDLRADRQPEFTQIDLEMSFVDVEDILQLTEGFVKYLFQKVLHMDITTPLPRMTYQEAWNAMVRTSRTPASGMELQDLSDVKDVDFMVFRSALNAGGSVRAIVAKNAASVLTRKEIDKLTEKAKGIGAKGLAFISWNDEKPTCSFAKFLPEGKLDEILSRLDCAKGDVVLIVAIRTR
ncbi:MAG: aspartate--tRNA ligase [Ruminococcus callidus]